MSNVDDSNMTSPVARLLQKIRGLSVLEIAGTVVVTAFLIFVATVICLLFNYEDRVKSFSPDGSHQIVVKQQPIQSMMRNFRIIVIDESTREEHQIFYSQDQPPGISLEYFVWSADGRFAALIGDQYHVVPGSTHHYVVPRSILPNGLTLFLVYDLEKDRVYCNTMYEDRGFPQITAEEAIEIFGEERLNSIPPIRLRSYGSR